jgi:hypothetical protein
VRHFKRHVSQFHDVYSLFKCINRVLDGKFSGTPIARLNDANEMVHSLNACCVALEAHEVRAE